MVRMIEPTIIAFHGMITRSMIGHQAHRPIRTVGVL